MIIQCPKCGEQVSDKSSFCASCGEPLKQTSISPVSASSDDRLTEKRSRLILIIGCVLTSVALCSILVFVIHSIAEDDGHDDHNSEYRSESVLCERSCEVEVFGAEGEYNMPLSTVECESYGHSYDEVAETSVNMVYSNAFDGYLNIRATPTSNGTVIGKFRNGHEGAEMLGVSGEWVEINYDGVTGYVYHKYVSYYPTEEVTVPVDADWLKGVWMAYGDEYAYLIFSNGTYAVQCSYGTAAYGIYMLEGADIVFMADEVIYSLGGCVSYRERFTIYENSKRIGRMSMRAFVSEEEQLYNGDNLTWTSAQYAALRKEIRNKVEN